MRVERSSLSHLATHHLPFTIHRLPKKNSPSLHSTRAILCLFGPGELGPEDRDKPSTGVTLPALAVREAGVPRRSKRDRKSTPHLGQAGDLGPAATHAAAWLANYAMFWHRSDRLITARARRARIRYLLLPSYCVRARLGEQCLGWTSLCYLVWGYVARGPRRVSRCKRRRRAQLPSWTALVEPGRPAAVVSLGMRTGAGVGSELGL